MYVFLLYRFYSTANAVNGKRFLFVLQTETAENEGQYTLTNIICFEFENCYFFPGGVL